MDGSELRQLVHTSQPVQMFQDLLARHAVEPHRPAREGAPVDPSQMQRLGRWPLVRIGSHPDARPVQACNSLHYSVTDGCFKTYHSTPAAIVSSAAT
jgi:hypothetical protein